MGGVISLHLPTHTTPRHAIGMVVTAVLGPALLAEHIHVEFMHLIPVWTHPNNIYLLLLMIHMMA